MLRRTIDLRSDTVTEMSAEMRTALAFAVTGDMLYGDDPYVRRLEESLQELFGLSAVWMPSCTMANLVAVNLLSRGAGSELILGSTSHINVFERKNGALAGGMAYKEIRDSAGRITVKDLENAITEESEFFPQQAGVAVENTHNLAGGRAFPPDHLRRLCEIARRRGLRMHLDGARIFNASLALDVPLTAWRLSGLGPDSLSVSLSKGLGTPAGAALLLKHTDDIPRAHRVRKALGGTMHTGAGYLAAAAVVLLRPERYAEVEAQLAADHRRAKWFADELEQIKGCQIVSPVETNIVYVALVIPAATAVGELRKQGILCSILSLHAVEATASLRDSTPLRFVFHRGILDQDVLRTVEAVRDLLEMAGTGRKAISKLA